MMLGRELLCGTAGGNDPWSINLPRLETTGSMTTAPSGRRYARHVSQMGSVMFYRDMGRQLAALILDAMYRFSAVNMYSEKYIKDISLPKITTPAVYYLNMSGKTKPGTSADRMKVTDDWLAANMFFDPNLPRDNGDVWMNMGSPAVTRARKLKVSGLVCDIPTINLVMRISSDREVIKKMDPTAASYSQWDFSDSSCFWSSTVSNMPGGDSGYSILDNYKETGYTHYCGYGLDCMIESSSAYKLVKDFMYVPVIVGVA